MFAQRVCTFLLRLFGSSSFLRGVSVAYSTLCRDLFMTAEIFQLHVRVLVTSIVSQRKLACNILDFCVRCWALLWVRAEEGGRLHSYWQAACWFTVLPPENPSVIPGHLMPKHTQGTWLYYTWAINLRNCLYGFFFWFSFFCIVTLKHNSYVVVALTIGI